jgi:Glycosyl hydrolases family 38 N-terminal domain/Glycosyl hydrolases family 38 C-terminal domain
MKPSLTFLIFLFAFSIFNIAQNLPFNSEDILLQGYTKTISGTAITYPSAIPYINSSLIVRAEDGTQSIEWETEKVPQYANPEHTFFIWLSSIGSNNGREAFDFYINGERQFTFYSEAKKYWMVENHAGVKLYFHYSFIDRKGDYFGYMFLKLPSEYLVSGKSVDLKIVGSKANSSTWVMTYTSQIKSELHLHSYEALLRGKSGLRQLVMGTAVNFGNPVKAEIEQNGKILKELTLYFGGNLVELSFPEVKVKTSIKVYFRINNNIIVDSSEVELVPVKRWTINFVQHAHTDIGYTRPQTEILPAHLRYIDYALDYCDATDNYPDDSKFRWTCEGAWAVNAYLNSRPKSQIERLIKRIKEGRIELTGMYLNFNGLTDENILAQSLDPIEKFKKLGLKVKTGMQDDVNGIGWCMIDYYNTIGVKYLDMGVNVTRSIPVFDKPTAFWWESPSGEKLLAYRGEHYMEGNFLGIQQNDIYAFETNLLEYISSLEQKNYPFNITDIQYSGYYTDNSPPSTQECDMIKKWNEKFAWPHLRNATISEFFEEVQNKYGKELPVYKDAWPDWWTDGFGSNAEATAVTREGQAEMISNNGALAISLLMGSKLPAGIMDRIQQVNNDLLFYDEHTFGSAGSISDPYSEMTNIQSGMKSSFAWDGLKRERMIREEVMGLLQSHIQKTDVPTIVVFNTLNWLRTGYFQVYIDHQLLPLNREFRLIDDEGNIVPAQAVNSRSDGTYWELYVKNVPPMGYKTIQVELRAKEDSSTITYPSENNSILENKFYKITVDPKAGTISNLFDKELQKDIADSNARWKFAQYILENLKDREKLGQTGNHSRKGLDTVWIEPGVKGPIWKSIKIIGESETLLKPGGFQCEVRLFNNVKRIDFVCTFWKKPITSPQGIYIAFPFNLPGSKIYFEVQGGMVVPGVNQLPGSASDWNTIQDFAAVKNENAQIVFVSPRAPLVQFGDLNIGKFQKIAHPEHPFIYAWPMNNYWTTNFNAEQQGEFTCTYSVTSTQDTSKEFATKFGWETTIPLLARVFPAGTEHHDIHSGSLLKISSSNVLLVNAEPDDKGDDVLLHLREINGQPANVVLKNPENGKDYFFNETDVLGNLIGEKVNSIKIKPYDVKFIRISLH